MLLHSTMKFINISMKTRMSRQTSSNSSPNHSTFVGRSSSLLFNSNWNQSLNSYDENWTSKEDEKTSMTTFPNQRRSSTSISSRRDSNSPFVHSLLLQSILFSPSDVQSNPILYQRRSWRIKSNSLPFICLDESFPLNIRRIPSVRLRYRRLKFQVPRRWARLLSNAIRHINDSRSEFSRVSEGWRER